jgi:hypothetical protein
MIARVSVLRLAGLVLGLVVAREALGPDPVRGVSSTVVISEFRVRGPNGGSDEFVELFNLSSSPVDISGWKLRGSNAAGTIGTRATVPAGVVLDPGCHYLFTNSSTSGGPYSGPVPGDQTYATGITDDGGLAITLPTDVVVDQVGLSSGSAFKEGTPLASLGSSNQNRGYERKPGGAAGSGTDTDDNAADFQLVSPSDPQSRSSACLGGSTNPSGVGSATPSAVDPGGSTLLAVAVTPGTNPPSTGLSVVADLGAIGGLAVQPFFDDGTNGDLTAGDAVFSFQATVAAATTPGAKILPATVSDAQGRSGAATIGLTVRPQLSAIHDIQGPGPASPLAGQLARTTGVVSALRGNGFFVQTPDGEADADPATSQGLFVFTGGPPPAGAAVGNLVEVIGTVAEFAPASDPVSPPLTELSGFPSVTVLSTGQPLPAPTTLTAADTDPAGSLEQLERFEGMRVHVESLTVVAPTQGFVNEASASSTTNGIFFGVITGLARPFREAGIEAPNPIPDPPCCIPRFDANPERLRVDSDGQVGAAPVEVNTGWVIENLTGVLDFGSRVYTILPDPGSLAATGPDAAVPVPEPAPDEYTVASFNLERFFDTVNDPGVDDVALTAAAFERRLAKASIAIRGVLRTPDILGVVEVENLTTLQTLAERINADAVAADGVDPGYAAHLVEGNDPGGIDVGFLVKTARVEVVEVIQVGKDETYVTPEGTLDLLNDRPPLVLRAGVHGADGSVAELTVIVNHLRSLLGIEGADGPRVRVKRRTQAEFLAGLLQARQTADPGEGLVVIGDFNAFPVSDGYVDVLGTVKGTPAPADEVLLASPDLVEPDLVNLVDLAPPDQRYSFSFAGNAQALDHVLVGQGQVPFLTRFHFARGNADAAGSLRNDPSRAERLSDHDAPVAYYTLPHAELSLDLTLSPQPVIAGGTLTASATVTNGGPATATDVTFGLPTPAGTSVTGLLAPPDWSCSSLPGGVTCTAPTLAAGDTAMLTLTLTVDCAALNGALITATASVDSGSVDRDASDDTAQATVTVANPAPVITGMSATPSVLWPPNHRLVDVTVAYDVTDNCGVPVCVLQVASDEPDGRCHGGRDWVVVDDHHVRLRAERSGRGDGRVYTIRATCSDTAGGGSSESVTVSVPKRPPRRSH